MKPQRRVTTARHFAVFKAEAERVAKVWGLNDIGFYYHHGPRDARATFRGTHVKRIATLTLSSNWEATNPENPGELIADEEVRSAARHEVIHAMLLPLSAMVASYCTEDEAEEAEERIVQRLMRLLPTKDRPRKR